MTMGKAVRIPIRMSTATPTGAGARIGDALAEGRAAEVLAENAGAPTADTEVFSLQHGA